MFARKEATDCRICAIQAVREQVGEFSGPWLQLLVLLSPVYPAGDGPPPPPVYIICTLCSASAPRLLILPMYMLSAGKVGKG